MARGQAMASWNHPFTRGLPLPPASHHLPALRAGDWEDQRGHEQVVKGAVVEDSCPDDFNIVETENL